MTKLEKKIIKLLSDYPHQEFYGQEIADRLDCSKASVSGLLASLLEKGLVNKESKGRMGFFQINPHNLSVRQFKLDFAIQELKPFIERLESISKKVILFGSASRGEQRAESDYDLLIVSQQVEAAKEAINNKPKKLNLQAIIKTPSQWAEMQDKNPELYHEINKGITLHEYVPRI